METEEPKEEVKARVYLSNGRVVEFDDQRLAYQFWLALAPSVRAAFRGAGDTTPVLPWDYVHR